MTENEKARHYSANYRKSRELAGETQVQVWLPEILRERLDQVIKSGRFKNRSDATRAALGEFLESNKM